MHGSSSGGAFDKTSVNRIRQVAVLDSSARAARMNEYRRKLATASRSDRPEGSNKLAPGASPLIFDTGRVARRSTE